MQRRVVVMMLLTEKTMLLVMEFVSNGCLRDFLKKNNKTSPDELLRFALEIVEVFPHLCFVISCQFCGYEETSSN